MGKEGNQFDWSTSCNICHYEFRVWIQNPSPCGVNRNVYLSIVDPRQNNTPNYLKAGINLTIGSDGIRNMDSLKDKIKTWINSAVENKSLGLGEECRTGLLEMLAGKIEPYIGKSEQKSEDQNKE